MSPSFSFLLSSGCKTSQDGVVHGRHSGSIRRSSPTWLPTLISVICVVLFATSIPQAQIDRVNNSTSTPIPGAGHNYMGSLNETVDPGAGSVSVRIDVGAPSGRGIKLPFTFGYDSNGVHFPKLGHGGVAQWGSSVDILSSGGWSYTIPQLGFQQLEHTDHQR